MVSSVNLRDDQYVLNHCAKSLARDVGPVSEPWRFPVIDSHFDDADPDQGRGFNDVTFIHDGRGSAPNTVSVVGTFARLYEPVALRDIRFGGEATGYRAATVRVPKGQIHYYRFIVDGVAVPDPINPQRSTLDNGVEWSRFVTQMCTQPINFERWEYAILDRLTDHILPFRTKEGQNFLNRFYYTLDRSQRETRLTHAYRLDNSVGVVNFIDALLSREEQHRLVDYKICLGLIRDIWRQRWPVTPPARIPRDAYVELYDQMAANAVPGWDFARYDNPRFFLQLLRRHAITGAFSHPKYGGNCAATGWAFLSERYLGTDGQTLFAWRRAIEKPFGESVEYRG